MIDIRAGTTELAHRVPRFPSGATGLILDSDLLLYKYICFLLLS